MKLDFVNTTKKQPKARYIKPESVTELERLHFEQKRLRHPEVPFLEKTKFRDDTTGELTRCILAWLRINGHFGARVNTTGIYNEKLGKYIRSGSRKGMADITSVINGKHVSIEIKTGRDRMRTDQLKVKNEVEKTGGIYIIVSSFDNFLEQIENLNHG